MSSDYLSVPIAVIDIILFLLMAWGAYKGYQKGFLTELLSFVIFIVMVIVVFKAIQLSFDYGSQKVGGDPGKASPYLSFMIAYCVICLVVSIIGKRMAGNKYEVFEGFDHFIGMIMGVFKYGYALAIALVMATFVGILNPADMKQTIFYPILSKYFDFLYGVGKTLAPFIGDLVVSIRKLLK